MNEHLSKSLILSKIKSYYRFQSNADFARFLGIGYNTLSNWYSRNTVDYELIATKCVEISGDWLLSGTGDMLKANAVNKKDPFLVEEPDPPYMLTGNKKFTEQLVPLYNTQASAGLARIFSDSPSVLDYISIPNLPRSDGAIYITGDSMYPLLKSGDIVIYKKINDIKNSLLWGEMYLLSFLVDDDDFTMVKYIHKSDQGDEYITLVSQNQHHQAKDIAINTITALALIKASIRFNAMN